MYLRGIRTIFTLSEKIVRSSEVIATESVKYGDRNHDKWWQSQLQALFAWYTTLSFIIEHIWGELHIRTLAICFPYEQCNTSPPPSVSEWTDSLDTIHKSSVTPKQVLRYCTILAYSCTNFPEEYYPEISYFLAVLGVLADLEVQAFFYVPQRLACRTNSVSQAPFWYNSDKDR